MTLGANGGFDNAAFWDERYRTNLSLGSGGGSRGENLQFKRQLLQRVIDEIQPRSILDVGCGDLEVTRELAFDGAYTGIDASPFITERNRALHPTWCFLNGDFVELAQSGELRADLVICLDVLIHQHDRDGYRAFVRALLDTSESALLVNGFEGLPKSNRLSPNVAFHEPISRTLRDLGASNFRPVADFRRTKIMLVETRITRAS